MMMIRQFIRRRNMSVRSLRGRRTTGSRDECRTAPTLGPSPRTWAIGPPLGSYETTSTIAIIITQPESNVVSTLNLLSSWTTSLPVCGCRLDSSFTVVSTASIHAVSSLAACQQGSTTLRLQVSNSSQLSNDDSAWVQSSSTRFILSLSFIGSPGWHVVRSENCAFCGCLLSKFNLKSCSTTDHNNVCHNTANCLTVGTEQTNILSNHWFHPKFHTNLNFRPNLVQLLKGI